jgi:hypothetical protein
MSTPGYTRSDPKVDEIMRELYIPQITEFVEPFGRKSEEHAYRMSSDRDTSKILKYHSKGRILGIILE